MGKKKTIQINQLPNDVSNYINELVRDIVENDRSCFDEGDKISFPYDVIDGVIQPFDENTHHGNTILTDEETETLVRLLMTCPIIGNDVTNGYWITIDDIEGFVQIDF